MLVVQLYLTFRKPASILRRPASTYDAIADQIMTPMFENFDIETFWEWSDYADQEYVDSPLTNEKVAGAERLLGFKLPMAYVALMKHQNGGIPRKTIHRTKEPTSWSKDHIAITGIYSIGGTRPSSLCGTFSSQFWVDEWGYPPIGVYFADCPSAGHDMVCLDYRECGPSGEPNVVHVDQEFGYKITFVAHDFESFIRGLESEEVFDE
jgi:SMI1-KNR4 cell-wall